MPMLTRKARVLLRRGIMKGISPLGLKHLLDISASNCSRSVYQRKQTRFASTMAVRSISANSKSSTLDQVQTISSFSSANAVGFESNENSNNLCRLGLAHTPLGGSPDGVELLQGLDVYEVPADGDMHPLSVYGICSRSTKESVPDTDSFPHRQHRRKPILLLHGRTWSAVPVYHLLGNQSQLQQQDTTAATTTAITSRSLMQSLYGAGMQPYTMDFRGFGGTHPDATGFVVPNRCVQDAATVLRWIMQRHTNEDETMLLTLSNEKRDNISLPSPPMAPALLGWSQGALVAQLLAQQLQQFEDNKIPAISHLIFYGSIYNPAIHYPNEMTPAPHRIVSNTWTQAVEDFTLQGTIPEVVAYQFAKAALITDPYKACWRYLHQFNACDPSLIPTQIATLILVGDCDPYAPVNVQRQHLYERLHCRTKDMIVLEHCDHAAHLLEGRDRLIKSVVEFCSTCC